MLCILLLQDLAAIFNNETFVVSGHMLSGDVVAHAVAIVVHLDVLDTINASSNLCAEEVDTATLNDKEGTDVPDSRNNSYHQQW